MSSKQIEWIMALASPVVFLTLVVTLVHPNDIVTWIPLYSGASFLALAYWHFTEAPRRPARVASYTLYAIFALSMFYRYQYPHASPLVAWGGIVASAFGLALFAYDRRQFHSK